jgi:hypothetical protein
MEPVRPQSFPSFPNQTDHQVTWTTGFGCLLASCAFLVYHNREVSYSSLLDLSISARQQRLYEQHGLNIERWTESVAEAKTLRKEITRIAADYDIEWKGELEHLADDTRPLAEKIRESDAKSGHTKASNKSHRSGTNDSVTASPSGTSTAGTTSEETNPKPGTGKDKHLDIDKTIDEASELAEETEEQRNKEKAAQRKGENVEDGEGRGVGSKQRRKSVEQGKERGKAQVGKNHERFE